jgi:hypothetical protein
MRTLTFTRRIQSEDREVSIGLHEPDERQDLQAWHLGVMGVSYCVEQALIQSCSVENNFAVMRRADRVHGYNELSGILDVYCDLRTISQRYIAYRAAGVAAFFQIYLGADLDFFLIHNTIPCFRRAFEHLRLNH